MRLGGGVEWALHCTWLLSFAPRNAALPTRRLAEFYELPEAYLAKVLNGLVRAGLLTATTGPRGGFRLARPPEKITVAEVVAAVEGRGALFLCTEVRQRGPAPLSAAACRRACGIANVMEQAEQAWWRELEATTVADLVASSGVGAGQRVKTWMDQLPEAKEPYR